MHHDADSSRLPAFCELAAERPLALFLDFDGTLVEIAPAPDAIAVPPALPSALERLGARVDGRLALVSGRSLADLARHLGIIAVARAGSHGIECEDAAGAVLGEAKDLVAPSVLANLRDYAATRDGLLVEAKTIGAALHYRAAPDLEAEIVGLTEALAAAHGLAIKRGKCVVELVPPGTSKAAAVNTFLRRAPFAGALPVFIGDDLTDEDGFAAAIRHGGFGILVGNRAGSAARYTIESPAAVRQWLQLETEPQ